MIPIVLCLSILVKKDNYGLMNFLDFLSLGAGDLLKKDYFFGVMHMLLSLGIGGLFDFLILPMFLDSSFGLIYEYKIITIAIVKVVVVLVYWLFLLRERDKEEELKYFLRSTPSGNSSPADAILDKERMKDQELEEWMADLNTSIKFTNESLESLNETEHTHHKPY